MCVGLCGCVVVWVVWVYVCVVVWLCGCWVVGLLECVFVGLLSCLVVLLFKFGPEAVPNQSQKGPKSVPKGSQPVNLVWFGRGALFFVVWLLGCVVVCLGGYVVVWLCGCVVVWLCGCVVVWLSYEDVALLVRKYKYINICTTNVYNKCETYKTTFNETSVNRCFTRCRGLRPQETLRAVLADPP